MFERQVLLDVLNESEKEKAFQFKFPYLTDRYIVARGLLRRFLASYTSKSPKEIELSLGPYGKPFLQNGEIHFNLAHSHNLVVYAFSKYREVGIDVEYVQKYDNVSELPLSALSENDRDEIMALPVDRLREAFLKKWTHIEAGLKAMGTGLHNGISCEFQDIEFVDLDLPEGYIGSLAHRAIGDFYGNG